MDINMTALTLLYNDAVNTMINDINKTKCKIFFPANKSECSNCSLVTISSSSSNNVYKPGGPIPFTTGICPYCNGAGFKEIFHSEEVYFRCYLNKKDWRKFGSSIVIENSDCMMLGNIEYINMINQCEYIQIFSDQTNIKEMKYKLSCEPFKYGLGDSFFCFFIKRVV